MNELEAWNLEDEKPIDEVVLEKYGRTSPAFRHNLSEYLRNVIESVRAEKPGLVDGFEGRRSLELTTVFCELIAMGGDVRLRFRPKKCKLRIAS
jgi:hypothetical protein